MRWQFWNKTPKASCISTLPQPEKKETDPLPQTTANESSNTPEQNSSRTINLKDLTSLIQSFVHDQAKRFEGASEKIDQLHDMQKMSVNLTKEKVQRTEQTLELVQDTITKISDNEAEIQFIRSIKSGVEQLIEIESKVEKMLNNVQTSALDAKILAFNTSLEASRSGAEGKGFLAVADRMRNFSLEINKLSLEIKGMTLQSQRIIKSVTEEIESALVHISEKMERSQKSMVLILQDIKLTREATQNLVEQIHDQQSHLNEIKNKISTIVEQGSASGALLLSQIQDQQITQIEVRDCFQTLTQFDLILDVRRPDEFEGELGHIEGAVLLTLGDDFKDRLAAFPFEQRTLFVCRSGGRSARAARLAIEAGFQFVWNLSGGMLQWQEAGLPVAERSMTEQEQSAVSQPGAQVRASS